MTSTPFISVACRNYCPDDDLHMLYRLMFHGVERIGRDLPPGGPIRIYKNVHRMAHVIQPGLKLVVSQTTLDTAPKLSAAVRRLQVQFESLYDLPWNESELVPRKLRNADLETLEEYCKTRPHNPEIAIEPFYELLPGYVRQADEVPRVPRASEDEVLCTVQVDCLPAATQRYWLSRQRLEEEGLVRTGTTHVFRPDLFAEIEPFLNWRYFLKAEVHFPDPATEPVPVGGFAPPEVSSPVPPPPPGPATHRFGPLRISTPAGWRDITNAFMSDEFFVLQSPAGCTLRIQVEVSDEEESPDEAVLLDLVRRATRPRGARDHSDPMYAHIADVQIAAISYRGTGKHGKGCDRSWVVTDGRHFVLIEHQVSEKGSLSREALDAVVKTSRFTSAVK